MAEKKKIAAEFALRYRKAGKYEKSQILDEYLALSGSKSRKYAIFKLTRIGKTQLRMLDDQAVKVTLVEKTRKKWVYQPYYDTAVADMLELLWKNFTWPCGKLFAPFLRQNLDLIRLRKKYHIRRQTQKNQPPYHRPTATKAETADENPGNLGNQARPPPPPRHPRRDLVPIRPYAFRLLPDRPRPA
ncbi:MAG: hypothetical protein LBG08_05025 [Spirochaetaceae bacterium]|nr:hypothetical protein [Spirochaetaceae bacterium]